MATLIGLSLRVRLLRALPDRFKVDIRVRPGTHQSENAVNKQLNDKERVAAALENSHLFNVVQGCLASAGRRARAQMRSRATSTILPRAAMASRTRITRAFERRWMRSPPGWASRCKLSFPRQMLIARLSLSMSVNL